MIISGKVIDKSGTTLPQANVYISDASGSITSANKGTAADNDGKYSLDIGTQAADMYLTASYTGYQKSTQKITESATMDFALLPGNAASKLKEVVITATDPRKKWLWILISIFIVSILIIIYFYRKRIFK
jgi:hypothetical protein